MTTQTRILALTLLTLLGSSPALAKPSARERAFARSLSKSLGVPLKSVVKLESNHSKRSGKGFVHAGLADRKRDTPIRTRGLELRGRGLTVRRYRFESRAEAMRYVSYTEDVRAAGAHVLEVRGRQVVFLSGSRLKDAVFARRARHAAWSGLNAPKSSDALVFVETNDRNTITALAGRLSVPEGPLYRYLKRSLSRSSLAWIKGIKIKRHTKTSFSAVRKGGSDPFASKLTVSPRGGRISLGAGGNNHERRVQAVAALATLDQPASSSLTRASRPRRARRGASQRLNGLLQR